MAKVKLPKQSRRNHDLPKTQEQWVDYINQCHSNGVANRRRFEYQWVVNLCYFLGFQKLYYYDGRIRIDEDDQLTINRIAPFIESRHAKLTKNRPITRVIPNSSSPEDRKAAKYADMSLMHLWNKIDMEQVLDDGVIQMLVCGTSFLKTVWDANAGDQLVTEKVTEDGALKLGDLGDIEEEKIFSGEVSTQALSPFSLIPANDSITRLQDQEWLLERAFLSVSEVESRWPHLKGMVKKSGDNEDRTEYEKIVQKISSPTFYRTESKRAKMDSVNSEVLAKIFWMRPNDVYERGFYAIVIGDQLALADEFPNDYGKAVYPYVKLDEHNSGFHFWNQSTLERLIPIQKAYNNLKDQKAKNARLTANAKWMLAKGSQVPEDSITDEEGEVVEYNPSVPEPHQAKIAPLPNYVENLEATLIGDFRDAGGQREAPFNPPPSITASVALQTLNELAEEVIIPISRRLSRSLKLNAHLQLMLIQEEWTEKRQVKIFGDSDAIGVEFLSETDLKNHTDVHVELESMLPELRGSKRQALFELWDRRIIQDPNEFIRLFKYGNFDSLGEKADKIEESFILDLQQMKTGKEVEVTPFQDHVFYASKLTDFLQTPEFNRMIPQRKQLIINNLQRHLAFVQNQAAAAPPEGQPNGANTGTPFGPQKPVGVA